MATVSWDSSDDRYWVNDYLDKLKGMSVEDLYNNIYTDGWQSKNAILDYFDQRSAALAKKNFTSANKRELQALLDAERERALQKFADFYTSSGVSGYNPNQMPNAETGGSLTEPNHSNETVNSQDQGANAALSDAQKAIQTGLQQAEQQSQEAARNAAAAGVSKSQAGSLADNATQGTQTQNVGNMYASNSAQRSSTQADYLEKMQNVANLQNQANLVGNSASSAALSGALSGGAAGLSMGMSLVSDERMKRPPRGMLNDSIDEKEIRKAIKQFKELYARLQELKKEKE